MCSICSLHRTFYTRSKISAGERESLVDHAASADLSWLLTHIHAIKLGTLSLNYQGHLSTTPIIKLYNNRHGWRAFLWMDNKDCVLAKIQAKSFSFIVKLWLRLRFKGFAKKEKKKAGWGYHFYQQCRLESRTTNTWNLRLCRQVQAFMSLS